MYWFPAVQPNVYSEKIFTLYKLSTMVDLHFSKADILNELENTKKGQLKQSCR